MTAHRWKTSVINDKGLHCEFPDGHISDGDLNVCLSGWQPILWGGDIPQQHTSTAAAGIETCHPSYVRTIQPQHLAQRGGS